MLTFYNYKVKENEAITTDVFNLVLEPVNKDESLPPFKPGQWISLAIFNEDGSLWNRRPFSIASSPTQTNELRLIIKLHADFTTRAQQLKKNATIGVAGPFGNFVYDKTVHKTSVLLAGGIGIAPFLSIIDYIEEIKSQNKVTLFYSAKTKKELVDLERLTELYQNNPRITVVSTVTQEDDNTVTETGRISPDMIAKYAPMDTETYFFLCGSKQFVADLEQGLNTLQIESDHIVKEKFY